MDILNLSVTMAIIILYYAFREKFKCVEELWFDHLTEKNFVADAPTGEFCDKILPVTNESPWELS